ncbi:uncharacterized protein LOC108736172 [Agrilus planipennis]|uniref:Uncharacterized protein LOC108736172 n=1 Tax=Agrilus planipennis TaxID=224129 RepID=A0A1W4WVB3_AGRPL|nr:uncharacterized protein LOC108736172 [Agrilus planipennis]
MCKYFAFIFIFYLLVFAKSTSDVSNTAIKFTSEIYNDNKVTKKGISNFDQTIFKSENTNNLTISKENLFKENESVKETQKENCGDHIVRSKVANSQRTNTTDEHTSHNELGINDCEIDNLFIKSHNDCKFVKKIKLIINPIENATMKQIRKTTSVERLFLEKILTYFKMVIPNNVLKPNQSVQLIVTVVPEKYNTSGLLEDEIIKIFPSLYSLIDNRNISKDTSNKVHTTAIQKSNIEKSSLEFNDSTEKSTNLSITIRHVKDNSEAVLPEKILEKINGINQTGNQNKIKANFTSDLKTGTQRQKPNGNLKTPPSTSTQAQFPVNFTEESKTSQISYFPKKRDILSYEKDNEKKLVNDLHNQNKINSLNDIKPEKINMNEPRRHRVYKRVKKGLSRLFLYKQNDRDNHKTDFSFPKFSMPLFLLSSFKSEDFANKKSINLKNNKRFSTNEKYNPDLIRAIQTNLIDYFLNSLLFGSLLTAPERYQESDTDFIVDTLIRNGDRFFLDTAVYLEPKYHRLTNNHDNKKHKHKRRYFSKQLSTLVASSTNKNIVELLHNKDVDKQVSDDNEKNEPLRKKRSFTIKGAPTLIVSDNSLEVILTEKSSERYQPPYKVCRIKRNGLLSSTITSVACLMLSLGILCYFLYKRKCLNKPRRCVWFAIPNGSEIRERVFETNIKKENQSKTDDDIKMLYKNDNFQIA